MVTVGIGGQGMLAGMPEAQDLRATEVDGHVVITIGARAVFDYAATDTGLRNIAAVTLPESGFTGRRVAEVLGITEEYVSMLRGRGRREGSVGLVRRRGRPAALGPAELARARRWRAAGETDAVIGRRLGVHATTVGRAVPRVGNTSVDAWPEHTDTEPVESTTVDPEPADTDLGQPGVGASVCPRPGSSRIGSGVRHSSYAGVTLLHGYLHRVGAETIFGTLTDRPARRYDNLTVLVTATLGFALGIDTVEGVKHLRRAEAGAAVGLEAIPQLATLRARLGALADGSDPLALQRSFAAGLLAADPTGDPAYYVDDHFVPNAGAKPVAKGWNTERRHAQPGRDDTLLVDARGRAVVFGSGEPTGLAANLPGVLAQLRQVTGPDAPILVGFDRGGAHPVAFRACRDAGADWVTYRRAPLVAVTAAAQEFHTNRSGRPVSVTLADETVRINSYGTARQLTLLEHDTPVLQVLTSDTTATGVDLLCWLRARWRIGDLFKYAAEHHGIDVLADHAMDIGPDTRMVTNPARIVARKAVTQAEAELVAAERAVPQLLTGPGTPKQMNAALPDAHRQIRVAADTLAHAKTALRAVPAKIAATELDPNAKRARPHLARRALQMVLRLLAFDGEAWLAEHLNAYLTDPDEYRAITRHILRLGGHVDYTAKKITITLDRPDSPRIARALNLLAEELNATPACLPGDRRPLTYQIAHLSSNSDLVPT